MDVISNPDRQNRARIEAMSSENLALEACAGSDDCYGELVRRHGEPLRRFIARLGVKAHEAEDVAQEAFIRAHRNLGRYDSRHRFTTWLFTIARNLAFRRAKAGNRFADIEAPEESDLRTPSVLLAAAEDSENLWRTVEAALPESQQQVLWLMYAGSLGVAEIAERTGRSRSHVKVLLHRARIGLARHMRRNGSMARPGTKEVES